MAYIILTLVLLVKASYTFGASFTWTETGTSSSNCINIGETSLASGTWDNTYLCRTYSLQGWQWSNNGAIVGKDCHKWYNPTAASWSDNYLCVPKEHEYVYAFNYLSKPLGSSECVKVTNSIDAGNWENSYFCLMRTKYLTVEQSQIVSELPSDVYADVKIGTCLIKGTDPDFPRQVNPEFVVTSDVSTITYTYRGEFEHVWKYSGKDRRVISTQRLRLVETTEGRIGLYVGDYNGELVAFTD